MKTTHTRHTHIHTHKDHDHTQDTYTHTHTQDTKKILKSVKRIKAFSTPRTLVLGMCARIRTLRDGAIYHVTSKVNRRLRDLRLRDIKAMFLVFLKKAKQKYPFELLNFCIMDNHFHLLIKPGPGQSLSRIMQWVKGNFARYWNKVHHTEGHLWGGRFTSKIIEDVAQFLKTLQYIDENPVKAQLVGKAADWEFGGLYHDVHGRFDVVDIPRNAIVSYATAQLE